MAEVGRRGELLETQRWSREHAAAGLFGRGRAYGLGDGPGPLTGLVLGLVIAVGGGVAPHVVDLVRSPSTTPAAPVVTPGPGG